MNDIKMSNRSTVNKRIRRMLGILSLFIMVVVLSGADRNRGLQGNILIRQNNTIPMFYNGMFHLDNMPFELIMGNIRSKDNIEIFVYDTPEMFYRYSWPERVQDTVMFAPGTGMAMAVDSDKSFSLSINREKTKHYISVDRRTSQGNKAILRVNGFNYNLGRGAGTEVFYISIFVDGNKNEIVEKKEVAHFIVSMPVGGM